MWIYVYVHIVHTLRNINMHTWLDCSLVGSLVNNYKKTKNIKKQQQNPSLYKYNLVVQRHNIGSTYNATETLLTTIFSCYLKDDMTCVTVTVILPVQTTWNNRVLKFCVLQVDSYRINLCYFLEKTLYFL